MSARSGRWRRRLGAASALVVVVGVSLAAWLIGTRVQSPGQAAARAAAPEPSWVTAPVEWRMLSSTIITRGDAQPAASTSVSGPVADASAGGSGVVTGVFVARGDEVVAGDRVAEVAGRPVFVFAGATPAFRALRPGMTGSDVAQLQAGLMAGGCATGDSRTYDEPTKTCVEQLYADDGYEVARGSTSEVADLAAARAAVDVANDALATAQNTFDAASRPATAARVSAAQAAVDEAQRAHEAAVESQPTLAAQAVTDLDAALASLNALLAGSDPSGATTAGGGDASGGDATDGGGAATSGSGVAARDAARQAVAAAVDGVDEAAAKALAEVAATAAALQTATDDLAQLTAPPDVSAEQLAVDQQGEAVTRATADLTALEDVSGAVVPFGEVVFVPQLPARVDSVAATVGSPGAGGASGAGSGDAGAGSSLVVLASPTLQAVVGIPQASRDLVQEGAEVELLDEASGESITGTVRSIGDRAEPSPTSGAPSYQAIIDAALPDTWSGRNVRATFTTASTDHEVLVVPTAAVSSAADGHTRVQVERSDGTIDTVDVTTGLSADGFLQVTPADGSALADGNRVVIGR